MIGIAALALTLPILVQQSVNAGAAAIGAGSRSTFVATSNQLVSYRSGVSYYRGRWGVDHRAWLMDEQPELGAAVEIWVPPLGGREVWTGAAGSTLYAAGYLALLVGVTLLMTKWGRPQRRRSR